MHLPHTPAHSRYKTWLCRCKEKLEHTFFPSVWVLPFCSYVPGSWSWCSYNLRSILIFLMCVVVNIVEQGPPLLRVHPQVLRMNFVTFFLVERVSQEEQSVESRAVPIVLTFINYYCRVCLTLQWGLLFKKKIIMNLCHPYPNDCHPRNYHHHPYHSHHLNFPLSHQGRHLGPAEGYH